MVGARNRQGVPGLGKPTALGRIIFLAIGENRAIIFNPWKGPGLLDL